MSLLVKIALPVVIAVAAIWGYLTYAHPQSDIMTSDDQIMQQAPSEQVATDDSAASQVSARGTTDAALDADINAIDTQLQAASESSAAVDAGINDQAGDTSY